MEKTLTRVLVVLFTVFTLMCGLVGCGSSAPAPAPAPNPQETTPAGPQAPAVQLQIFAANSLERALPEVQALYTAAHPNVTFADTQFKASGDLVSQIEAGALPDILMTASSGSMDNAANYIDASTRINMFGNDLVIARGVGSTIQINSLEDINNPAITSIAIGDADAVPAGQYANQVLNSIGLYSDASGKGGTYDPSFEPKVALASSVGNAAKYIESGDCQIGFVYSSDIFRFSGIEVAFVTPADSHKPIVYPGAVLASSENAEVAADFLNFCLTDPEAQKVWSRYGFEVK